MASPDSYKIFISYGRGDAKAFVDRLEADLKQSGFRVWRDTTDLLSARPWEDDVRAALKDSNLVVAVLTPQSVRGASASKPDAVTSVCLDELHAARFDPPPTPILPILLLPCQRPFCINRLNYVDFQNTTGDRDRYGAAMGRLLSRIDAIRNGEPIPQRTVDLEPLDFDLYLKFKTQDFVGREWLVSNIFGWLAEPKTASTLLMVGEPGWGKTAFCGHLYSSDPGGQLLAAHFCRADRSDTVSSRRFVQSIAATTALRIPAYGELLHAMLEREPDVMAAGDPLQILERAWLKPLSTLDTGPADGPARYILIDGLDEAASSELGRELHTLLAKAADMFPEWLRIVATTRDRFGIPQSFPSLHLVHLDPDDKRNRTDIRQLIARKLAGGKSEAAAQALAHAVEGRANGNALVATHLATAARRSGLDAGSIAALPREMSALYRAILSGRFDPRGNDWRTVRDVLELVLATDGAIPIQLVAAALADAEEYRTRDAVSLISDLLFINNDAIQIFHQTLRDFLDDRASPFFVNVKAGATRMATFATKTNSVHGARDFLESRLGTWIARSDDPSRFVDQLPRIYNELFSRDFPFYREPDHEDIRPHLRLISALISAGQIEALVSIVELAMARAPERIHKLPNPLGSEHPPQSNPEAAAAIQACIWITTFVFAFIREIVRIEPEAKPQLRAVFERHSQYLTYFTFLGPALGYLKLGLSGYYEMMGDFLYEDCKKLLKDLD